MERWDGIGRRVGLTAVAAGLVAMVVWTATGPAHPAGVVTWAVVAVLGAASVARTGGPGLRWWAARVAGVTLGLLLVGAVADRFGLLGGPGAAGVSWGDWAHFRAEAAELVPWGPLVGPAAVAATVAELTLGGLLVAGRWWRQVGAATAGLFAVYFVAMVPGMGAGSVLQYGIPVLAGGGLLTAARGPRCPTGPGSFVEGSTATHERTGT
jgi:hypothetical protein